MNDISSQADLQPPARATASAATPLSERPGAPQERTFSPFIPLLLLVLAVFLWSGFQCYQLIGERQSLLAVHESQQRSFADSGKLRTSLDALARETAVLADKGNAGARLIVDELRKRGVTINLNAASATKGSEDKK